VAANFTLFGPAHVAILATIAGAATVLARAVRTGARSARRIRIGLGACLVVNEIVWCTYRLRREGIRFPEGLPLQLSDLTIWLSIVALLTMSRRAFEIAYYAGLTAAGAAVLTPDLWSPLASYPSVYFFLEHGGVIAGVVTMLCGGMARPTRGSNWRALLALNLWAAAVGAFNAVFGTNYMYLCRKPVSASLLDYLGPWPVYLAASEVLAAALFWLLWLPFRNRG
jgi:hypothetical integral membrane protein (TIGR02206 family)